VILGTHTDALAKRYGRYVRDELQTNPACATKVSDDNTAKDEWSTTAGGGMKCAGVGKAIMGYGAHLFVIDDPYPNWTKAWSATYRNEVEEWFDAVASTRLEPGASVVVLHHRMHPEDLTHYLLKQGGWAHISLPSLAVDAADPLGRAVGEPICPERFNARALSAIRRASPASIWEAMHQQNPQQTGTGSAYQTFHEANISASVRLRHELPLQFCIDFNRTPHMHCLVCQRDPAADTFATYCELLGSRTTIDLAAEMVEWYKANGGAKFPAVEIFGDASGGTASMQSGISEFYTLRQRFAADAGRTPILRVPGRNPPHIDRVNAVNDALLGADGTRRWMIHPQCERLITDLREQKWAEGGKLDKMDIMRGHAGDAAGYWVHYLRPPGTGMVRPAGRARVITAGAR
jgi:hypothetical protein